MAVTFLLLQVSENYVLFLFIIFALLVILAWHGEVWPKCCLGEIVLAKYGKVNLSSFLLLFKYL